MPPRSAAARSRMMRPRSAAPRSRARCANSSSSASMCACWNSPTLPRGGATTHAAHSLASRAGVSCAIAWYGLVDIWRAVGNGTDFTFHGDPGAPRSARAPARPPRARPPPPWGAPGAGARGGGRPPRGPRRGARGRAGAGPRRLAGRGLGGRRAGARRVLVREPAREERLRLAQDLVVPVADGEEHGVAAVDLRRLDLAPHALEHGLDVLVVAARAVVVREALPRREARVRGAADEPVKRLARLARAQTAAGRGGRGHRGQGKQPPRARDAPLARP